jgi:hypothetical protein
MLAQNVSQVEYYKERPITTAVGGDLPLAYKIDVNLKIGDRVFLYNVRSAGDDVRFISSPARASSRPVVERENLYRYRLQSEFNMTRCGRGNLKIVFGRYRRMIQDGDGEL